MRNGNTVEVEIAQMRTGKIGLKYFVYSAERCQSSIAKITIAENIFKG